MINAAINSTDSNATVRPENWRDGCGSLSNDVARSVRSQISSSMRLDLRSDFRVLDFCWAFFAVSNNRSRIRDRGAGAGSSSTGGSSTLCFGGSARSEVFREILVTGAGSSVMMTSSSCSASRCGGRGGCTFLGMRGFFCTIWSPPGYLLNGLLVYWPLTILGRTPLRLRVDYQLIPSFTQWS